MVSLWLLFKVFCIVIVIPQNLSDFQVNTPSQSPHSSKFHLQDDRVSQSQWGDSGRVSETFENFRREMQARLQAQEAKSARQEQLLATALEYFGHNMKIFKKSEETFWPEVIFLHNEHNYLPSSDLLFLLRQFLFSARWQCWQMRWQSGWM